MGQRRTSGTVSKDKSRGKWMFVFNIAKDSITGKRRQISRRGFRTKREAYDAKVKSRNVER